MNFKIFPINMKKIIKEKCDKCGKEFEKNRFDYTHSYIYCPKCMENLKDE